jgi:hypothetical protein
MLVLAIRRRARTPRRWAASSAREPSEVKKFHEKMSMFAPRGVALIDLINLLRIARWALLPGIGLLKVTPPAGVNTFRGAASTVDVGAAGAAGADAATVGTRSPALTTARTSILTSINSP